LKDIILRLQSKIYFFEEQFRLARLKQFSASTEPLFGQGELFNEAKETLATSFPDNIETIRYTRKKPKRVPLPKYLPHEEIIHDIPEE